MLHRGIWGLSRLCLALLWAAGLGGCMALASRQFEHGSSATSVVARLGPPCSEHALADGGMRLEYATGPYGKSTHLYRFDALGRLVAGEEVLTEAHFATIRAGMSADEVLALIGRPSTTWAIARQQQTVWSYRYQTWICQWFMVGVNPQGMVVDTAYGPDPMCEVKR
jgi:hypothetical protein